MSSEYYINGIYFRGSEEVHIQGRETLERFVGQPEEERPLERHLDRRATTVYLK
jgi:hypothetical protein